MRPLRRVILTGVVFIVLLGGLAVATPVAADTPTPTEESAGAEEPEGFFNFEILDNPYVFITMMVGAVGMIGLASKSLAVGAWGAYLTFAYYAVEADMALLTNILYVTLVLVFVGFGFKIWKLEGGSET